MTQPGEHGGCFLDSATRGRYFLWSVQNRARRVQALPATGLGDAPSRALLLPSRQDRSVPNIKSAKKDLRKSRAAAVRNRAQRSALRTALKKAKLVSASPDERLKAVSLLDRAARKGLIHGNAAARQKSSIAHIAASA
jgi:small subunit ribosomal protein S20